MRYQEYHPPAELAPWIKLFWVFEHRSTEPVPETIVADGHPELIIHFRSPFSEVDSRGHVRQQSAAVVCGQLTRPLVLHSPLDAGMIGIRFQPAGMTPFVSSSMQSLTDERVPAENLFEDTDRLIEEVTASSNDAQRMAACHRFLFRSLDLERENYCIRRALEYIIATRGNTSVETLATLMGISRRSMELAFQKAVGTSPKMYCRITRFRNLIDAVTENGVSVNWLQIALDSGFFDQSHLIRDFRRFAGESPTAFLAGQPSLAHLLIRI